jgi:hypothetical protein
MLSISYNTNRREISDPKSFQSSVGDREIRCAGTVFLAFCQRINIYCLCILPKDVEEAIRCGNTRYFSLIVTGISDLSYKCLPQEVIDMHYLVLRLKYDDVEVVPILLIQEVVRAKRSNSR